MNDQVQFDSIRGHIEEEGFRPMSDLERILPCQKIRALVQECWEDPTNRPTGTDIIVRLGEILYSSEPNNASPEKIPYDLTQRCSEVDTPPQSPQRDTNRDTDRRFEDIGFEAEASVRLWMTNIFDESHHSTN